MATILDGLTLSKIVRAELAERVAALKAKGITPRLDVIVAAQDSASVAYVNMKKKWRRRRWNGRRAVRNR